MVAGARLPDVVECAACRRRLDPRIYQDFPGADVPNDRVTRVLEPTRPHFGVSCPCGHYTVFCPTESLLKKSQR